MINHGVSGPNIRAAGVNHDIRTSHPYSVYSELDWEPAVERSSIKGADCYDRYRIRVEEMRQSANLVLQALDKIPGGAETYHEPGDPKIIGKGHLVHIILKIVEANQCSILLVEEKAVVKCLIVYQSVLRCSLLFHMLQSV